MKNHLKKINAPRTWMINRKKNTFITRPQSGAYPLDDSLPLGVIIRDVLEYTRSTSETKKLLNNKQVLVDGKRKKDHHLPVGLFDLISFPDIKKKYRVLLDTKGRLTVKEIGFKEADIKPCKIINKTVLSKNKIQLNLFDGKNIVTDKKCKVGDTVVISLPDQKITEVLELKKDALILLTKGKHVGDVGPFQEIKNNQAIYQKDKKNVKTSKKYLFVLGDKKLVIDINTTK
ncbi:30S ribosomal protein S4e [Candidatus Woesearchaeota archaeon]|nr:30S ribosomal protein S4e [Candidatus Woesearchaeota archaeon]